MDEIEGGEPMKNLEFLQFHCNLRFMIAKDWLSEIIRKVYMLQFCNRKKGYPKRDSSV